MGTEGVSNALGVGQRLSKDPSALLANVAFQHELDAARYLWRGLSMADLAHAIALDEVGLIPDSARSILFSALTSLHDEDLSSINLDPNVGDIYNNRDLCIQNLAGSAAGYLHTGRARREATTIAWQICCREKLVKTTLNLSQFCVVLSSKAREHRDSLMPDFTYSLKAQPTTLGHYLLGHLAPFTRHLDRLIKSVDLINLSPAGSASTNGSSLEIDRHFLADLLGFNGVILHTRDAMWAPDIALEVAHSIVQVMTSIDRLVEELLLWSTDESAYFSSGDAESRTSVIMPHKKNPYALTYLRGISRFATGLSAAITSTLLTVSGQPDSRTFSYLEIPLLIDRCADAISLLTEVIVNGTFHVDRLRKSALTGFLTTTEVCDFLSSKGFDNRSSHKLVGYAVRLAVDDGRSNLLFTDLQTSFQHLGLHEIFPDGIILTEQDFEDITDPHLTASRRVTLGGSGPSQIDFMADVFELKSREVERHLNSLKFGSVEGQLISQAKQKI